MSVCLLFSFFVLILFSFALFLLPLVLENGMAKNDFDSSQSQNSDICTSDMLNTYAMEIQNGNIETWIRV